MHLLGSLLLQVVAQAGTGLPTTKSGHAIIDMSELDPKVQLAPARGKSLDLNVTQDYLRFHPDTPHSMLELVRLGVR